MRTWFNELPPWLDEALFSLIAVVGSYLIGQLVKGMLSRKFFVWAQKTEWRWDDAVIEAIRKGVPFGSLLLGVYIAAGFWQLPVTLSVALNKALFVLAGLAATFLTAGVVGKLVALYASAIHRPVTSLTRKIAQIIIVAIGLLMILNGVGITITPILTALGVGGLAVALALQDTLSNLFAGFHVTMERQIRVGDYVKLESGDEGYVTDIGWRSTQVRMLSNNVVLVPNSKLAQSITTNYYLPDKELAVLLQVGVDYASDLEHVERVTCEVAEQVMQSVTGGVPTFKPFIRYHNFGDFSVNFTVILRGKEFVDQHLMKHEFIKRLHRRYEQEGISIPFPIRTIYTKTLPDGKSSPSEKEDSWQIFTKPA